MKNQNKLFSLCLGLAALWNGLNLSADTLSNLWNLAPGDRPYLNTDSTQRGLAFNAANGHLLMISRTGQTAVYVLNGDTGADLYTLNTISVSGGTFSLDMLGVADDGAVYAGNLSTSTTAPEFKLYRWANDQPDTPPTLAYDGDPAGVDATGKSNNIQRWGDTMDVRGAGLNTQIAIGSRASSVVAILTTANGTDFTATIITNAAGTTGCLGIAFGAGNTLWLKLNGQPLRHVAFDLTTRQATLLQSFATTGFPGNICPLGVDVAKQQLAGIAIETPDSFQLFDIRDLTNPPLLLDKAILPTDNANANITGSVDFGSNRVYVLDSNNGLQAYNVIRAAAAEAPSIITQPQNQSVLAEGLATFSVAAKGTTPLRYQWAFNGTNIAGATNASYTITNLTAAAAGSYHAVISNVAGSIISSDAVLTVLPIVKSDAITVLWKLAPGDRSYLASDNNQRGLAYNPVTTNVVLVSRTLGNNIYVLDGNTGANLRSLNTDPTIIVGGTFTLNLVGVAADGAVYACNLTTSGAGFMIYRWDNDSASTLPTVAYGPGDPGLGRCGDTFDVRGAGANTQILVGSRNSNTAAVFTTSDGQTFNPQLITTADAPNNSFGLGLAFGAGNTIWGKDGGLALREAAFDLTTGQGTTLFQYAATNFPAGLAPLSVDPTNNWLAAIALEQPDSLRLYDISDPSQSPVLLGQVLFPVKNENLNGTGAVDFGPGRLYALDSNNGIIALQVKKASATSPKAPIFNVPPMATGGSLQLTLATENGRSYVFESSPDLKTWTAFATNNASSASLSITVQAATRQQFYRAQVK